MSIIVNTCPCCGGSVLRHVRYHEVYWFCLSCRQEVPILSINSETKLEPHNKKVVPQTALSS
ncbi:MULTISPECIES: hypothetical protein [unclassified Anabaena]|jgi:ribosomal protein L37AE/L43A|uniref:hypothetical protein n=1 Tax=unclassified Anabaena TaxID=2619674 RepID=UPI001447E6D2|nr:MULTISPECIES: hypothetical protein [unclassified Anabaena]MTJ10308.1 hypothetical protein [Anabaena sp. UHCC 0204]MTJ54484.1 hypothetical protein [Anabaena sp. UHCC 0253]